MQVIVDANVLISILIKPGKPVDLLLIEELDFASPELLFEEIENNKELIIQKSGLSKEEIGRFIEVFRRKITVVPEEEFLEYREKAEAICPDEKDITYFALALRMGCPIWSNEKKLKEQDQVKVWATHELMRLFNIN